MLSLRNDLLYIWSLNSEIKAYNTVPVYEGEFPKAEQATQEIFANVKVEVRNKGMKQGLWIFDFRYYYLFISLLYPAWS